MESKAKVNKYIGIGIKAVMAAVILVQSFLCLQYILENGGAVELFEESIRYINASVVKTVNGWELIGYPMIMAMVRSIFGYRYGWGMLLLQLAVTAATLFYTIKTWSSVIWKRKVPVWDYILIIGYLMTNPFIFQMMHAFLPDILALDVFLLSANLILLLVWGKGKYMEPRMIGLIGCVLLEGLLNRHLLWTMLLFLLGTCLGQIVFHKTSKGDNNVLRFAVLAGGLMLAVGISWEVNHVSTDYSNYMRYSLVANMTERFVYPHMMDDYPSYSGLVTGSASRELFENNNERLDQFKEKIAPLLEHEYGKKSATRIYVEMIKTAFLIRTKEIVVNLAKDLFVHFTQVFSAIRIMNHNHASRYGYNISRMWEGAPGITMLYIKFGVYAQAVVGALTIIKYILELALEKKKLKWTPFILLALQAGVYTFVETVLSPVGADYRIGIPFMVVCFLLLLSSGGDVRKEEVDESEK